MEANELRIGNWVTVQAKDLEGNPTTMILELKHIDFMRILSGNNKALPIPLTEEWLVRFGFDRISNGWMKTGNSKGLGFSLIKDKERGLVAASVGNIVSWKIIEYVHQLQNLYHCLVGEELELKK